MPEPKPFAVTYDPPPSGPRFVEAREAIAQLASLDVARELDARRDAADALTRRRDALHTHLDAAPGDGDASAALSEVARALYFETLEHGGALFGAEAATRHAGHIDGLRRAADVAKRAGDEHGAVLVARELRWEVVDGPSSEAAYALLEQQATARSANAAELRLDLSEIALQRAQWDDAWRWAEEASGAAEHFDETTDFHCRLQSSLFQASVDLGILERAAEALAAQERAAELSTVYVVANHASVRVNRLNYLLATSDNASVIREVEQFNALVAEAQAKPEAERADDDRRLLSVDEVIRDQLRWRRGLAEHEMGRTVPESKDDAVRTLRALVESSASGAAPLRLRAQLRLGLIALEQDRLDDALTWFEAAEEAAGASSIGEQARFLAARGLAQLLAGEVSDAEALEALERAWRLLLADWDRAPQRRGGVGFLHFGERRQVLSLLLAGFLEALDGETAARRGFDALLSSQSRGTLTREQRNAEEVTAARVQASLLPDELLLAWMPGPERTWLFEVTRNDLRLRDDLPPFTVLERLRNDSWRELSSMGARGTRALTSLANALVPKSVSARRSEFGRWSLSGLDLIGSVPFEALPVFDESAIGLAVPLTRYPSLPLMIALGQRPASASGGLQALLAPEPSAWAHQLQALPPLPVTPRHRAEFHALASSGTTLFEGGEAHLGRLREPAALRWVLAHGVYEPSRSCPAGIALSASPDRPDGILRNAEAWLEEAPADVVILASCGAARGPVRRGDDGSGHLGGAFLRAGAQAVVLSRASVRFEQTMELSLRLLHHLVTEGQPLSDAMMLARRDVAAREEWSHPFHHSLLRVEGLGHRRYASSAR